MTFPVVEATNTSTDAGGTSHVVNLPASIAAGNLLVIFLYGAGLGGPDFSTPSGWTQLFDDDTLSASFACYYKIATGSEGASVTVTSASDTPSVHNSYRISGYTGTPEAGTTATGTSTTPDPPSLTPSWGADDDLWIAATGCSNASADLAAPTNYGNIIEANDGTISAGSARRELNAASENPGTFSNASNSEWQANTVAIRGISVTAATKMKNYKQRRAA